jgi:serine/threonine-protein kinase
MAKKPDLPNRGATGMQGVAFGRYLLKQKIAHGGMAEVFLGCAMDADPDGEQLVIKCILPELAREPQFLGMFINEAQLAAQMKHPNIVKVLDFGEVGGRLYMVMEYVEGLDCWRFARRVQPWGQDHAFIAVWLTCQVLDALHYAHGMTDVNGRLLNVIHRDLSPSNIYLSVQGSVKLGDFGIAKIESRRYRRIQMIPQGKFGYVAPEQVEGRAIDRRADIFAIGIVLTELLIGKKMFTDTNQLSVLRDIKEGRLDALDNNVERIEPELSKLLYRALARNPADRYNTAADFRNSLRAFLKDHGAEDMAEALSEHVRQAVELRDSGYTLLSNSESTTQHGETAAKLSLGPPTRLVRESEFGAHRSAGTGEPFGFDTPITASETPIDPGSGTPVTHSETPFDSKWLYTAKLEDGVSVGPAPFAHIIELICSDRIGPQTLISVNGGSYTEASHRPELARHLPACTPIYETGETTIPDRRGSLAIESPSAIILVLVMRSEDGMLVCNQGGMRKEVYFRKGKPHYVSSNNPDELLGEYLVSREVIERTQLETALSLLPKFNGHLGDTLIALGMLSAVELFHYIGKQIEDRFRDLIDWKDGQYRFYRHVPCPSDVLEISLDPIELIREKVLMASESIQMDTPFDKMKNTIITPSADSVELAQRFRFTQEVDAVLGGISKPCRLQELLEPRAGPQAKHEVIRALYIGWQTGLCCIDGPFTFRLGEK